ncbi:integrase family protein [Sphingobium sp.]|uniref:tyrosine-type recombinase/integrase n=1 Tax=Sphingobium sp. TaxID=1912891 RepID=UPI0025FF5B96|nr:integrase family protein [Sphingobium sp.]
MAASLTKNGIEALILKAKNGSAGQLELHDDREPGLRIRAGQRSASWSYWARLKNGQPTRIKLGSWPGMGIAEARIAAQEARAKIVQGHDLNEEKRVATREAALEIRTRTTLKDVLDLYEELILAQHRRGTQTRRALDGKKGLMTTLANRKPASITRAEISDLVRKHARQAPISANRKLAYASAFFNWCVEEEILTDSPAKNIRKPAKENERDRFHTLEELREVWAATTGLGYPFEQLYRLLIVLPMRREEISAMPIVDLTIGDDDTPDQGIWALPAGRTKNAKALRVPLSPLARSIILKALNHEERPKESKLLFSTTGETSVSGFTKAKRRIDKAIHGARIKDAEEAGVDPETVGRMPHWTVHDLRTTFNTHACEILGVPPHVADRILNHVATATRSKIMRVYNKSEMFDARKTALCDWADLLSNRVIS